MTIATVRLPNDLRYPVENARKETTLPSDDQLTEAVAAAAMNFQVFK